MEAITEAPVVEPGPPGSTGYDWSEFPWWLVGIVAFLAFIAVWTLTHDKWMEGFRFIRQGLSITIIVTVVSFVFAITLGLIIGLARLATHPAPRQLAMFFIELVRGVPVIVTIFAVAFVIVPAFWNFLHLAQPSLTVRAIVALSLIYAAFIAEVFRAGIEAVPKGQLEAGRSVGLSERQITRLIVLPQAIRNIMPALGNDLIALLKDSSLASILAVRELTQMARLWSGSNFQFRAGFGILVAFYLTLTVSLSLLLRWYEKRIRIPGN